MEPDQPDPRNLDELLKLSKAARQHSYAPYSKFTVGSSLLCTDGTIYTGEASNPNAKEAKNLADRGCNVENVVYGLVVCAERTALVKAVSEGHQQFKAIFINSSLETEYTAPCGACRQFMAEFGLDWDVYMTKEDLTYKKMKVKDLLPEAFTPYTFCSAKKQ